MDHQKRQADRAGRESSRKLISRRQSWGTRCRCNTPCLATQKRLPRRCWPSLAGRLRRAPNQAAVMIATRERIRSGDNHHSPHPDELTARFIDPRTLSKAVDDILPKDRVVASDSGHFCGWVPRYLRVPNPKASCLSHSFQSVGLGLASAIGLGHRKSGQAGCARRRRWRLHDVDRRP